MSAKLIERLGLAPAVQSLVQRLEQEDYCACEGVAPSGLAVLVAALSQRMPRQTWVIVADGVKFQEQLEQDLTTWLELARQAVAEEPEVMRQPVLYYPGWEILPHESKLPHADVISDRLATLVYLDRMTTGAALPPPIVVTEGKALLQRTFPPGELRERIRHVQRDDALDPLDLIEWLESQGYEPEAKVTQKGELALRGGILDVYPLTTPWPVRLEFFGSELESLRWFDPVTQLSRDAIEEVTFSPGGELGLLKRRVDSAKSGESLPGLGSLVDHLPPRARLVFCEPERLAETARRYLDQQPAGNPYFLTWEEVCRGIADTAVCRLDVREGLPEQSWLASLETFRPMETAKADLPVAERQRREFFAQLHRWMRQHFLVSIFCNNDGERQRFEEIWRDYGFDPHADSSSEERVHPDAQAAEPPESRPFLAHGALSSGFICAEAKLVVVTDAEVFGRYKVARPRRLRSPHAQAMGSAWEINFSDLDEGDYVVHLQYGIGRFLGLQVLPATPSRRSQKVTGEESADTGTQECLVIEYAPRDNEQQPPKLYVPVTEAHLVSKYVGAGKARPQLNTLGGTRWIKAKAQAAEAVRDLAGELLSIQAARASQAGHAFDPDTPWQREFEGAFLYTETPDQLRAIAETKCDLESTRPMDRLICGDVGFGKTEVALRAVFKVVMGGKQAAVLVPTTVLAQQHYNNFRERVADYPVRIELLSRFRSRRDQARVIRELAAGSVDVVIGTHRLLQPDIVFKDLGLVVIDEEQRFGVLHKERFKRLRRLVDVLTLSATPIPRTLYLALTGARDMSTLETPPQDRLPVETHVVPYDERLIRDAIRRELNRQGQVFYLHNRVTTIETVGQRLRALVPEARIAIGHGQMDSDDLESVMSMFVNGDVDVLLSTTIIESGLDIPNANTILIDRADRFGLSDLYQLRGRVGRYKHQAYAYFLLPRHATLLADARKRISAIKQYSSLGSGFKIAMRDLEIRGAGNLLGLEQSGHITAVGFDLYCQLLKQSVAALKGETVKPRIDVQVVFDFLDADPVRPKTDPGPRRPRRSPMDEEPSAIQVPREVVAYIESDSIPEPPDTEIPRTTAALPLAYVPDPQQRIDVYRKLAQTTDLASLNRLRTELTDRFGPLPEPAERLLMVTELKILAAARGFERMETRGNKLMLTRFGEYFMVNGKFPRLTKTTAPGRLREIKKLLLAFPT
ncbi:MAG TPA: transcription-repair coupling factor [Candidatus Paceibacterota bacterium]|nr:transcription-repair coupling factor [Verrucomicrobiota bacterium]HRY47124.1 transcription-repair coupling factor [Candidatus Paceibacterota bacterium]HSA00563.1 transcription-repair coupling factor [Candidatus Paceibacterota bacterium]